MIKHINLNIVHNDFILNRACLKNTNSIVLEVKIPFSSSAYISNPDLKIIVICGYGDDEPIKEVLNTAQLLPDVSFYLTGKSSKLKNTSINKNVQLTGYLRDKDYEDLLRTADIILVLTTRPETVLCGAYETVGLEKPLITSDTPTLRKYFNKGTVFTKNDARSIVEAVNITRQNLNKLHNEMIKLRKEKALIWEQQFEPVIKILNG
jgi:hypothetical protein